MAVRVYRASISRANVPTGGSGIETWITLRSPGNLIKLLAVHCRLISSDPVTQLRANPFTSETEYFDLEINSNGGRNPFTEVSYTPTSGVPFSATSHIISETGRTEGLNIIIPETLNAYLWTYNFSGGIRTQAFNALFYVDETPLT